MGLNRLGVHALVVVSVAVLAYGAAESRGAALTLDRDVPGADAVLAGEAKESSSRVVYYGRLGVPFLPRDGRIAMSGAPLQRRVPAARPTPPSCATRMLDDASASPELAQR